MDFLQAAILGVIEGITEFLPISSTGHLILASKFLAMPESDFLKSYQIAIQLGAIMAVVALFWKKLLNFNIWKKVIAAFIPTIILGIIFYSAMKAMMGSSMIVIQALFWGGIAMILLEKKYKENSGHIDSIETMPYKKAAFLGVFQTLAMIPGISRSGATILGGLGMGLKREVIVEFSFFLAVPTMLGATMYDLYKTSAILSYEQFWLMFSGFLISFIVALAAIRFLIDFVKKNNFVAFGIYRIILALSLFIILK